MHPKGPVWNHFKESVDSVVCNHCNKNYNKATAKSSTNPLWYHLKVKHNILPDKLAARSSATSPKKPATSRLITSFVQRKSQQKMYAELAATDRLSFNQIARSDFIRSALRDKIFIAHSSPTTIRSKVFEFYQEKSSRYRWVEARDKQRVAICCLFWRMDGKEQTLPNPKCPHQRCGFLQPWNGESVG